MFGDYTIQQAAEALDTCDEVVIETIARGGLPTYRQFLLFGPIRIKKAFIDDNIGLEPTASRRGFSPRGKVWL